LQTDIRNVPLIENDHKIVARDDLAYVLPTGRQVRGLKGSLKQAFSKQKQGRRQAYFV
jgi:hypothetical protein